MNSPNVESDSIRPAGAHPLVLVLLLVVCAPWGVIKLWRQRASAWLLVPYAVIGLPLFILIYGFLGIVGFGALLPELDLHVSEHAPRTVRFKAGNYESTFVETARDTHGAHEFIRVQIQPHGGNEFHYHRDFEETFTVEVGELTVSVGERTLVLKAGESVTAPRRTLHTFKNVTDQVVTMTVKVEPARGLEKSIRVAYGLSNTNGWDGASRMKKMWWIALQLGYSGTYLPDMPPLIQEPLVDALAKIAQWTGEDQDLQKFFGPELETEALAAKGA